MKRELTQQEIDAVFQKGADPTREEGDGATNFDFSRLDRIPKSQLRAIHLLHETFVRNLSSSLSAYLRCYSALNLVSLEQISYSEFLEGLSSPTCLAYIGMLPYDATTVLEVSPGLMFSLIELLLGGNGRSPLRINRKITEIEQHVIQLLMRVVLRDLSEAWKGVADIKFEVQSLASEPQLLHVLAPAEAVVVLGIEVRVGNASGMMSFAIPSIFIKRLRNKFDQLRQIRRVESTHEDQLYLAQLLQEVSLQFQACLNGETISTTALLNLKVGDVLVLDYPMSRSVQGVVNGKDKWVGEMVRVGDKLAFELEEMDPAEAG